MSSKMTAMDKLKRFPPAIVQNGVLGKFSDMLLVLQKRNESITLIKGHNNNKMAQNKL